MSAAVRRNTMLSSYPACFFKEGDGYSVIFPDLNFLATCGDSLSEAVAMSIDCLAGYLYTAGRDGDEVPPASDITSVTLAEVAHELELDSCEGFVNLVTVDVADYAKKHFERPVKKTLTIPAWLNDAAIAQNINFSQVLREALEERLS